MNPRPTGISILSVLYFVGGIVTLVMQAILFDNLSQSAEVIAVSPATLMVNMAALGVWGIVAGFGMWRGLQWAWWLGCLYLAYSVLRNANALLLISQLASEQAGEVDTARYYIKHAGRVVVHSLVAWYFFKDNVLQFFGLPSEGKAIRGLKVVGLGLGIFATVNALALLL